MALKTLTGGVVLSSLLAFAAFAHDGVENHAVMARMQGMKSIAEQMKILGNMSKGQAAFDAIAVNTAAASIKNHAEDIPTLFESEETDPKSEAKRAIWSNWEDFIKKVRMFEAAAEQAQQVTSPDELNAAVQDLGDSCKACHEAYRIKR